MPDADDQTAPGQPVYPQLCAIMADVLEIDGAALKPADAPCDLPNWSSLTFLVMLVGIEKRFGITFEPEIAVKACSVGSLAELITEQIALQHRDG